MKEGNYEVRKGGRLGPSADDTKDLTVLNRVLRCTPQGFEYEADPRQAEKLLEGLKLDGGCNAAATPGLKPLLEQLEGCYFAVLDRIRNSEGLLHEHIYDQLIGSTCSSRRRRSAGLQALRPAHRCQPLKGWGDLCSRTSPSCTLIPGSLRMGLRCTVAPIGAVVLAHDDLPAAAVLWSVGM